LVLRDLAHWPPTAISAVCGSVVSAALIVAMLFEGWPANRLGAGPGRAVTLGLTALVALALNRALAAYADGVHWTKATPDDWVTVASLAFIGAGIILHVGIGLRWPFAAKAGAAPKADAKKGGARTGQVRLARRSGHIPAAALVPAAARITPHPL